MSDVSANSCLITSIPRERDFAMRDCWRFGKAGGLAAVGVILAVSVFGCAGTRQGKLVHTAHRAEAEIVRPSQVAQPELVEHIGSRRYTPEEMQPSSCRGCSSGGCAGGACSACRLGH